MVVYNPLCLLLSLSILCSFVMILCGVCLSFPSKTLFKHAIIPNQKRLIN
ncbi:hypothetical protein HanPSC8_Chr17g0792371 [Helianthus annuus]|nr:hypothetical protein HanPSC8_Chr17g0792371 [Helianthus annuus]